MKQRSREAKPNQFNTMQLSLVALLSTALALVEGSRFPGMAQLEYIRDLSSETTFDNSKCPSSIPLSCSNDTVVKDSCCFEYPGGVLLQTQFWDYSPSIGPNDSFTAHGLWPDNCSKDGSYQQFCNSKLNVGNVEQVLQSFGEDELIANMKKYWKNMNGDDASLWKHEFNKHGTCVNTINPSCYGDDFKTNQNVVDYFKIAMNLYEKLPTFEWLSEAGIVPSHDKTYTKDEISKALADKFGSEVYIACDRNNGLQEVWYFHQLKGSLLGEQFHHIDSFSNSKCPNQGIKFVPKDNYKNPGTNPSQTKTSSPPKPTGDYQTGFVKLKNQQGCLIKNGQWYVSGTCATYRLQAAEFGGYNLRSNGGYCALDNNGDLSCSQSNEPFQFGYDESSKLLSVNGQETWHADKTPSGFQKVPVAPGDGEVQFNLKFE